MIGVICMPTTPLKEMTLDELCNQSIQGYLDFKGIPYDQQGPYLRLKGHDSLVVDTRIGGSHTNETFFWNSQGIGGNLYHFLRNYENLDKAATIAELKAVAPQLSNRPMPNIQVTRKPYQPEKWQASQGPRKVGQMLNYLQNVRKLDPVLVHALMERNLVRPLSNGDAFFAWVDNKGQEVGGDVQGTRINYDQFGKRGTRKMIARGSRSQWGFHFNVRDNRRKDLSCDKLYLFESPIDALSFFQMNGLKVPEGGNRHFVSLNGAGAKVKTLLPYLAEYGIPKEIHLGFDRDEAGINGIYKAVDLINQWNFRDTVTVYVDQPATGKDWNDALKAGDHRKQVQTFKEWAKEHPQPGQQVARPAQQQQPAWGQLPFDQPKARQR